MTEPKALHEYRRPIEQTERDLAAKMLAEGASLKALAKALECGDGRAKRIASELAVVNAAKELRMTSMVPEMLDKLLAATMILVETNTALEVRMTAFEREMRTMNKKVYRGKVTTNQLRERNKSLRDEVKALRDLMRRRGLVT
ncbi:hypothetical protein [uncultured Sphingomonas sp.]|uniref:hypothetical protein n=1 Tax=uncultured Sphingomonas sp. TaxID=158754 RepID=UPI002627263C|nr:hypothetical protein [uncultured Sphingomonas sp.]